MSGSSWVCIQPPARAVVCTDESQQSMVTTLRPQSLDFNASCVTRSHLTPLHLPPSLPLLLGPAYMFPPSTRRRGAPPQWFALPAKVCITPSSPVPECSAISSPVVSSLRLPPPPPTLPIYYPYEPTVDNKRPCTEGNGRKVAERERRGESQERGTLHPTLPPPRVYIPPSSLRPTRAQSHLLLSPAATIRRQHCILGVPPVPAPPAVCATCVRSLRHVIHAAEEKIGGVEEQLTTVWLVSWEEVVGG